MQSLIGALRQPRRIVAGSQFAPQGHPSFRAISLFCGMMLSLLLVLCGSTVQATDYHLTSASQLQSTFYGLNPGDTVYIAAGDYSPVVAEPPYNHLQIGNKNGTSAAWITIKNEPGARPRLFLGGAGIYNGFSISNSSYIRVEGIELVGNSSDTGTFGFAVGGICHHIQIVKNVVHNFGGNGIGGAASQYLIEGNVSYDNCKRAPWGPSGISLYEPQMYDTNNTNFAGTLGNPGDYSIIIRNNVCYDNVEVLLNNGGITDGNGIICDDFQHTQNPGSPFSGKTLICNNVCYNNGGRGVELYLSDNIDVFNNTCYQNLRNLGGDGEIGGEGASNRLFNNLCWTSTGRAGSVASNGVSQWANNLYFNMSVYVAGTADVVGQNPLLINPGIDPTTANFRPQTGSPVIGAGTTTVNIATDADGNLRTGRNDIGAYQNTGVVVTAPPTFNPAPGTYPYQVSVTLATTTAGASIRYTINGTQPTATTGTLYSGPITLTSTTTIRAIAYAGSVSSAVVAGTYTIISYQVNSGGAALSPFVADAYFTGGTATSTTKTIKTGGVANAAPAALYQTERWGAQTYTFPNLTAGRAYTVRLHFAEIWFGSVNPGGGGVGSRKFHVNLNGGRVLTDFDIFATAGAANKANVQQFTVAANASGQIIVDYLVGSANSPKSSGIEILP